MANYYYLQQNIFEWLSPILTSIGFDVDENVTWDNQNAPRPDMSHWISLSLTQNTNTPENDVRIKTNKNDPDRVDQVVYKRTQMSLRINIYGDDSLTLASLIQQSMSLDENVESAGSLGIGYVSTSNTQDLSQLISGNFKSRAMFTILFNHTDMIGDSHATYPSPLIPSLPSVTPLDTSIGTIGTVTIIGEDENGDEIVNTTIQEP